MARLGRMLGLMSMWRTRSVWWSIKLRHNPISKSPNRAVLPAGAGEHEMVADIADTP
jgi:hypothetical protein